MNKDLFFSSKTDLWATPAGFFADLDAEFHFNLDPCATTENAKCKRYFTAEQDGLKQDWGGRKYFAIHRMVEPSASGSKKHTRNRESRVRSSFAYCPRERIQGGFTTTS